MINPTDVVSLELMKRHLRVDDPEEDEYILFRATEALDWCLAYTDEPAFKEAGDLPPRLRSAFLMVLGDLYASREYQTDIALYSNETAENMLWSCRRFHRNDSYLLEQEAGQSIDDGGYIE